MKTLPLMILLVVASLGLASCATKTPPEFLRNASAGMFGGVSVAPDGTLMSVSPAPKRNGFDSFYNGGVQ